MIRKLLIANRGEIACRVIRTARRLGIESVAVYSDADADALHVRMADRAVRIGPAPARESYLDIDTLIRAIRTSGADAVHPGYGFLSENAQFADAVTQAGCTFVGPPARAIAAMGSKAEAKRLAADAGVAVVPGYHGEDQGLERLRAEAARVGFPILIKPSAGGGGKGMRRVDRAEDVTDAITSAKREAMAAFGDDRLLLERYIERPKHIEIQVLADGHGRVLHLFERDCSVQRRHQKVIEEAPAPRLRPEVRQRLAEAAVALARAIDYRGAGTVEFIGSGDDYFFMEMNTRLQVEHPVTEAITGLDLVEWQLRIAAGEPLPFEQPAITMRGCAVEARIYAENPRNQFLPSTGHIRHLAWPVDVRVDAGVVAGGIVSAHYDPMLAKIIACAPDRAQAVAALDRALATTALAGVEHNIGFLRRVLADGEFAAGSYDIGLLERRGDALHAVDEWPALCGIAAVLLADDSAEIPWACRDAFRVNLPCRQNVRLEHAGHTIELQCEAVERGWRIEFDGQPHLLQDFRTVDGCVEGRFDDRWLSIQVVADGRDWYAMWAGNTVRVTLRDDDVASFERDVVSDGHIMAPMPGQVLATHVRQGESVAEGQPLLVLEAMKMEHTILAPLAGVVESLSVSVGSRVEEGTELAVIRAAEADGA